MVTILLPVNCRHSCKRSVTPQKKRLRKLIVIIARRNNHVHTRTFASRACDGFCPPENMMNDVPARVSVNHNYPEFTSIPKQIDDKGARNWHSYAQPSPVRIPSFESILYPLLTLISLFLLSLGLPQPWLCSLPRRLRRQARASRYPAQPQHCVERMRHRLSLFKRR